MAIFFTSRGSSKFCAGASDIDFIQYGAATLLRAVFPILDVGCSGIAGNIVPIIV